MNNDRYQIKCISGFFVVFFCLILTACSSKSYDRKTVEPESVGTGWQDSKEQKRQEIMGSSERILMKLYKANPEAKSNIKNAAGYAVFSNFGLKILVAGGGTGNGVAVSNETKQRTFMKMVEVQAGLGFGIKKFQLVFVFATNEVMDTFINEGWQFGGQTTASLKTEDRGNAYQYAISVSEGLWLYQMTEKGIALEVTGKGTKFYRNNDLNE